MKTEDFLDMLSETLFLFIRLISGELHPFFRGFWSYNKSNMLTLSILDLCGTSNLYIGAHTMQTLFLKL